MKNYAVALTTTLALLISGCELKLSDKTSSGQMGSKEFALQDFKEVAMKGSFDLYLSQGDEASLEVSGDESLVSLVEVSQEGDVLTIFLKRPNTEFNLTEDLKVSLTVHQLEKIAFEGVGQIKSTQELALKDFKIEGNGVGNVLLELDASQVEAALNIVGKVELLGKTDRLVLKNDGIGAIDASRLISRDCKVESSGIGAVSMHCTGELSLEMSGIGSVTYKGNPTVIHEKVSGLGKVNRN
jgi:hypothetical protein